LPISVEIFVNLLTAKAISNSLVCCLAFKKEKQRKKKNLMFSFHVIFKKLGKKTDLAYKIQI
jgi:hypothetical protein